MTGYIRNDTTDNISNGNVINAEDLDGEFNAVQTAFDSTTGHNHDGTVGGGAPIGAVGPAQDVVITISTVRPKNDNTVDLGTPTLEFKNLYLDGTAQVDTLQVDESATITADLTVNGNTTLGNASTDTLTLTAQVATSVVPSVDDTIDLGSTTKEWRNLYIDGTANIDSLVADTADINGGTIDGTVIGGTTTAAGSFTSISASGNITVAGTVDGRDVATDGTKLDGIEAGADVTDTANVTAAGALMDSELTNITAVKALNQGVATTDSPSFVDTTFVKATGASVTLQRNDTAITSGEALGAVNFQAVNVAGGGDAVVVAAAIKAEAKATFDATTNTTSLLFQTANSGAVETRMEIDGIGNVAVDTNTLYVDATNNRVGVGNTSPTVTLDVTGSATASGPITSTDGASGASPNSSYNNFVAQGSTIAGMSILTPNTGTGGVFFGDPDNNLQGGIQYAHTTDSLNIYTGGANRVIIDASGDVGIGVSPSTIPTAAKFLAIGDSDTGIGQISDGELAVFTNFSERVRFDSAGNVGIGTTDPLSKLDVNGDVSLSAATTETRALQVGQGRTGNGTSSVDLVGDATYADYGLRLLRQNTGANTTSQLVHRGTGTLAITAAEAGSIRFDTTNTSRMSIAAGGDVSIVQNLSVAGDITGGNLSSGTYTPTLTAVANVATSSTVSAQYMRVGNTVTVSGRVTLTATAANTDTTIRVSLPIASDLTVAHSLGGTAASVTSGTMGNAVGINGDVTNNAAVFSLRPVNTNSTAYAFSFTYRIE